MKNIDVKLFNTLNHKLELFVPIEQNKVLMYVCGPTVYDYVHVGNMRPVVVFDVLRRLFLALDYEVTYVSNYTDVDDRIIEKALQEKSSEKSISEFYIDAYEKTINRLNALLPTFTPKAMDFIPSMINFIEVLVKHDAAYVVDGEVFFNVDSTSNYGELSNTNVEELQVGARVDENEKKKHPQDFLLWKKTNNGIKWDSPWGEGRPGWHTECVVMINEVFNKPLIDIHGGGFDLKFPHHENEIAQSKAYANTKLANYWLHNGFINLNNQKMAKSTGNTITADDFIKKYGGSALRLLLLSTHYRAPVNLSDDIITNTQNEVSKLRRSVLALHRHAALNPEYNKDDSLIIPFLNALADDLNTPNALSELYSLIKKSNVLLKNSVENALEISALGHAIDQMLDVLGLDLEIPFFSSEDVDLLVKYEKARADRDFAQSDVYRQELVARGIF